jgi:hypothetical protein
LYRNKEAAAAVGGLVLILGLLPFFVLCGCVPARFDPADESAKAHVQTIVLICALSLFVATPVCIYASMVLFGMRILTSLILMVVFTPLVWVASLLVMLGPRI